MTRTHRWLRHGWITLAALAFLLIIHPSARAFQLSAASDDDNNAGQTLTVEHEVVALTFVSATAGWNDRLGWEGPVASAAFDCRDAVAGLTVLVGSFPGREELELSLTTPDGVVWTAGPGEGNSDRFAHARLRAIAPDTVRVEWEDLPDGGDLDYDDCVVDLRITALTK
jgi:hypothetical protein